MYWIDTLEVGELEFTDKYGGEIAFAGVLDPQVMEVVKISTTITPAMSGLSFSGVEAGEIIEGDNGEDLYLPLSPSVPDHNVLNVEQVMGVGGDYFTPAVEGRRALRFFDDVRWENRIYIAPW